MSEEKRFWFPAKKRGFGWGWGFPVTWEGWVVMLVYLGALVGAGLFFDPGKSLWVFLGLVLVLTGGLFWICFKKGEPPGPFLGQKK
ncbi:MAG: hypothetical protein AAGC74_10565 [Verrucomicrobiota bacterium]